MILTKDQEKAIQIILDRYKAGEKYAVLAGWAGTGKSTCVKFIINALLNNGVNEEEVVYTSFTGKAVQVLIDKGNKNAKTLHKLLYFTKPLPNGKFLRNPVPKYQFGYKVVVVDEVSMVSKELVDLLLSYNAFVIFMGDNGQLPPVDKTQDNHLLDHPHAFLDQIMRQAEGSGIIQLSMKIRNGENISNFVSDDAIVVPKSLLTDEMLEKADIVLTATNKARMEYNNKIRALKGMTGFLAEGDKIINLRNNWDIYSDNDNALTNGCIGYVSNFFEQDFYIPSRMGIKNNKIPIVTGEFVTETGDSFGVLDMDKTCLMTGQTYLSSQQKYKMSRSQKTRDLIPMEFTYGNAITCHKSQGSSWGKIVVIEEQFPFDREEHKRWAYTAITRAEDKIILVR